MNICPNCHHRGTEDICPRDGFPMVDDSKYGPKAGEPDLLGKVFNKRYEVEKLLGRGGMGWVYRARHILMQHPVALKIMRRELGDDLNAVKRFYQEARACSHLTQPHTIKVHDFGTSEDGFLYLAMEFLEGGTLKDLVAREGSLPPLRAIHISRQVLKSLAEAHALGMVHRDLKPDNVFLAEVPGEVDYVKVLDFGIAKFVQGENREESLTRTGLVIGTPKYMSPEQARGLPLDGRSDLYSLGILLYEMLTGKVPFEGDTTMAILLKQSTEPPPPLPQNVGTQALPGALRVLVGQLLDKDPNRRPASAADVEGQLESIAQALRRGIEGATARGGGRPERIEAGTVLLPNVDPAAGSPAKPDGQPPTDRAATPAAGDGWGQAPEWSEADRTVLKPRRRRALLLGLAGAGVCLVAAVATWVALSGNNGRATGGPTPLLSLGGPAAGTAPRPAAPPAAAPDDAAAGAAEVTPTAAPPTDAGGPPAPAGAAGPGAADAGPRAEAAPDAAPAAPPDATPAATGPAPAGTPPAGAAVGTAEAAAAAPAAPPVRVVVTSTPPGAVVYDGNERLGETPLELEQSPTAERVLTLKRPGFRAQRVRLVPPIEPRVDVRLKPAGRSPGAGGGEVEIL